MTKNYQAVQIRLVLEFIRAFFSGPFFRIDEITISNGPYQMYLI